MAHVEKLKHVLKTYGTTALVFHTSLFAATLSSSYVAIKRGVDIKQYLEYVPFVNVSNINKETGTLAVAYISTLATGPARGALTITVAPVLSRLITRSRRHFY